MSEGKPCIISTISLEGGQIKPISPWDPYQCDPELWDPQQCDETAAGTTVLCRWSSWLRPAGGRRCAGRSSAPGSPWSRYRCDLWTSGWCSTTCTRRRSPPPRPPWRPLNNTWVTTVTNITKTVRLSQMGLVPMLSQIIRKFLYNRFFALTKNLWSCLYKKTCLHLLEFTGVHKKMRT